MRRIAALLLTLSIAGLALGGAIKGPVAEKPAVEWNLPAEQSATVPGTSVKTWELDPAAPRKFATADGPGRRVHGSAVLREAGTYKVLVEAPDGTRREVARAVVAKPETGRIVRLRFTLDATDTAERTAQEVIDR